MFSTRALQFLPEVEPLRRVCQAVATLDAILSPDPEFRYFRYDKNWSSDQQLASMRDDMGGEWFLLFTPAGTLLKGFVPDATMAEPFNKSGQPWPGIIDRVPAPLSDVFSNDQLGGRRATFCVWRLKSEDAWRRGHVQFPLGPDPDGSEHLMGVLDGDPVSYARWAEQYYEIEIPFIEVRRIYMHRPMTEEMARALNANVDWNALTTDLESIGYPRIV